MGAETSTIRRKDMRMRAKTTVSRVRVGGTSDSTTGRFSKSVEVLFVVSLSTLVPLYVIHFTHLELSLHILSLTEYIYIYIHTHLVLLNHSF